MARKKTSDGDNGLKVVELPKSNPKIILSNEWLELSQSAMEMALHAAQVEILVQQADKARKFSDMLIDDFITAKKLRDSQQQIFMKTLKKILG